MGEWALTIWLGGWGLGAWVYGIITGTDATANFVIGLVLIGLCLYRAFGAIE